MVSKTSRFFMAMITVGLILLISIQILMRFPATEPYFSWAKSKVQNFWEIEVQEVNQVVADDLISIKLLNPGDFSNARILVNDEQAFYFENPILRLPVKDGDQLTIDTRGYSTPLWFEIIQCSPEISNLQTKKQYRLVNSVETIQIEMTPPTKY